MKKLIEYIILYFVFLMLLWLQWTVTKTWRIQYPLLVLIVYYCFDAFRNISNFKRTYLRGNQYLNSIERNRNRHGNEIEFDVLIRCRRRKLIRDTFKNMMLALTCILLIFSSSQVLPIPLYFWVVPLVIAFISNFVLQICSPSPLEITIHVLSILYLLSWATILAFILAKIDEFITWKWSAVLWAYWVTFAILVILSLVFLIIFLTSIKAFFEDLTEYQSLIGSLWLFIFFGGLTTSSFMTTMNTSNIFDNNSIEASEINIFLYLFLPNLVYLTVILCLTFASWWPLISWFDYILYGGVEEVQEIQDVEEGQQIREIIIKNVRLKIPVFIKRISNTLFTKSTKRERQAFQLQLQRTEEYKQTQSELNVRTEQIDQNRVKPSWSIKTDIAKLKYHHKIASFGVFQQEAQLKYDSNHIKSQPVLNHQSEICNEQISRQKFDYINRDNESSCSDFRATRNNSPVKTYARNTERLSKFNKLLKSKFRSKHNFLFCRKLKI